MEAVTSMERDRQTDRQAGRQAGRQADRQIGRQAGRLTDRQAGRQADRQAGRQTDRDTHIQTDRNIRHFDPLLHSPVQGEQSSWQWSQWRPHRPLPATRTAPLPVGRCTPLKTSVTRQLSAQPLSDVRSSKDVLS